jgi:PAS domain S-box-containing protein
MVLSGWRPYAFAVLCVAAATAIRFGLGLVWPEILIFAVYYPAVLIATLACGVASGITATLLGALAAWWLFVPPAYQFLPIRTNSAAGIVVYLLSCALIVWAADRYRSLVRRLRAEIAARERAQRDSAQLAMLVTQSPDAIFSANPDGAIVSWNPGAAALFGYSAEEATGRPQDILLPEDKRDEFERAIARMRAGEALELETEWFAKGGERIAVDMVGGPLRDAVGTIIGTCVAARDIRDRQRHQKEMQVVLHELSHRAKNLLSVVSAMANQTARSCETFEEFQPRFADRLRALAASHDALVERNWAGVPMAELVRVQLAPFDEIDRVVAVGPDVVLIAKAAEQIGLCLHELGTNATKYGALSTPAGIVEISWELDAAEFRLTWRERGGPAVAKPIRTGFGSLVLQRLVSAALNGKAVKEFAHEGITWRLRCPAGQATEKRSAAL